MFFEKKKKKTTTTEESAYWLTDEYRAKRRLSPGDPKARGPRGPQGNYKEKIDAGVTKEYIPKLQAHLKTLPGGDAMAKKVEGWGAFKNGHRGICYVDPDAKNGEGKCYRTKPKVVAALTAEVSA